MIAEFLIMGFTGLIILIMAIIIKKWVTLLAE
jgi:hypothetical protein